jgi:hypothetical protein
VIEKSGLDGSPCRPDPRSPGQRDMVAACPSGILTGG